MGEKNLWSKLALIVVLVGLCAWQVWPPQDKLKPGIDLGGGHSLLFEIDDTGIPTGQRAGLANQVMDILKQRVDPGGTRNLIWRPIGWNRLEIQMPRPPEHLMRYRQEYEQARSALMETAITEAEIHNALNLPPDKIRPALEQLVKGVNSRVPLIDELAEVVIEYQQLEASTTQPSGEMAVRMDDLISRRLELIEALMNTNVPIRILTDILELDPGSTVRAERLEGLKEQHPGQADLIDNMASKYEQWSTVRGVLDDPTDLMRMLRGAGKLEFRILAERDPGNPNLIDSNVPEYRQSAERYIEQLEKFGPRPREGDDFRWFPIDNPQENSIAQAPQHYVLGEYLGNPYVLAYDVPGKALLSTGDNSWQLRGAMQDVDQRGRPAVRFELDNRGGRLFGELTRNNLKRPLCILLDEEAMSAPLIDSEITTHGVITGNFSMTEVNNLINILNAGVLPARLKEVPLQQTSIGPSLGETNRNRGIRAVIYAFVLTIAFMAIYYSYSGVIADIALLMNLVITLGVMSFIQATFTLPGIAGLVLVLGMSVDANVLIFERIREELNRGVSVRMAVRLGYERAFSAILDSNVTTIIIAIILGSLGSEEIKGFGLTLGIGLCSSMFTALFVTRQFFHVMLPNQLDTGETKRAWLGTGLLLLLGALFMGTGYLLSGGWEAARETSLGSLGMFLSVMFITAAVLMISLWAFRIAYRATGHHRAGRLPMMQLIGTPKINWIAKHKFFWTLSAIVIAAGIFFEANIDKDEYLDIEFLGGTSVQLEVKDALAERFATAGDVELLRYINAPDGRTPEGNLTAVEWLRTVADRLAQATVRPVGENRYLVTDYGDLTFAQVEALLYPTLADHVLRDWIAPADEGVAIQLSPVEEDTDEGLPDAQAVTSLIRDAGAEYVRSAAERLRNARVTPVEQMVESGEVRSAFEVVSTEPQKDIVAQALIAAMKGILDVTQPIEYELVREPELAPDGFFPIRQTADTLGEVLGNDDLRSVAEFRGGVALIFDDLQPAVTAAEIEQRLRDIRLQPEFADVPIREKMTVLALEPLPSDPSRATRIAVLVADPSLPYVEGTDNAEWSAELAEPELRAAQAALSRSRALQRVTQFAPQVAGEAVQKAIIAIILSMIAIAIYLWIRFGSLEYGLSGIIALFHDVAVTFSCVIACHYLYGTWLGQLLLLEDFKLDLAMIAAFLTIVGYSINDTIVIFDRVRENRGRMAILSPTLINDSLNQTLSRTIITSLTTLIAVLAMYLVGGSGIHGFAFAIIVGLITGTYSTLAIATPMLLNPRAMWVTTIAIITIGLLAVARTVETEGLKIAMMVVILIVAGAAFVRQWRVTAPAMSRGSQASA